MAAEKFFRERDNGRYGSVVRGPVNWAKFPFDKYKFGAAILCDITDLFPARSGPRNGMREMTLAVELMTQIPSLEESLQEDIGDILFQDCTDSILSLLPKEDSDSSIVFGYEEGSGNVVEVHDVGLKVQGVIFTIRLYY